MKKFLNKLWASLSDREHIIQIAICLAFLVFFWFTVFGEQGLYQLHKSFRLRSTLQRELITHQEKIEHLKEEKRFLNHPKYLELVIRQELGYVKDGEVVFQRIE